MASVSVGHGPHQHVISLKAGTLQEPLFEMQMTQRKGIDIYQSLTPW